MPRLLLFMFCVVLCVEGAEYRGVQFIGITNFADFSRREDDQDYHSVVLISKRIEAEIPWNELVISWNNRGALEDGLKMEAKVIYPDRETIWYCLGKWALQTSKHPRESITGQMDADGRVDTDILKMKQPSGSIRIRITILTSAARIELPSFVGISFCDNTAERRPLPPNKKAWGKVQTVVERSQLNYPDGASHWCSPTSISMVMSFWAKELHRTDLEYDVPVVARAVHDPNWPGTGNWPFNTAFAGAHAGMRAYVTRLSDVAEIEDWIEAGIPVILSVANGFLQGKSERGNGHLVVAAGFNEIGDIVVNDPGRTQVRQTYSRGDLIKAWAESNNTVYLIYPEVAKIPRDRFGNW